MTTSNEVVLMFCLSVIEVNLADHTASSCFFEEINAALTTKSQQTRRGDGASAFHGNTHHPIPARGVTIRHCLWQAAAILAKSGLSKADLGRLWAMADVDRDGKLCRHEFAVAMHLAACAVGKAGALPLTATLPPCLAAATATATVAVSASDQRDEDKEEEVEGRVVMIDDAESVMSSLGYPEGLSDVKGSERGDVVGTGDNNAQNKKKSTKMSEATSSFLGDSEAADNTPNGKRDAPKVIDGGFGDTEATAAKRKTSGKGEGDGWEGEEAGMEKGKEGGVRYSMNDQDAVRYGKAFAKLVKGKGTKVLGEKEVRIVCTRARQTIDISALVCLLTLTTLTKNTHGFYSRLVTSQLTVNRGNTYFVSMNLQSKHLRQAAVILAKSGLGKAELGRLWAISDADRDGALSRVEFSIAMHLASCSANKGLTVPSALPDSLDALLPRESKRDQRTPVAEGVKKTIRSEPNQTLEKSSAHSSGGGYSGRGHPHRSVEAGGKDAGKARGRGARRSAAENNSPAAVRNKAGGQAEGEGGHQGGRKGNTKKYDSSKEAERVGQKGVLEKAGKAAGDKIGKRATTAENEIRPSKKRGFGVFSSSAGTKESKKHPSAENEPRASRSAPAAHDRGGKKNKIPKKEAVEDDRKTPQEFTEAAVVKGKRISTPESKQRAGSKLLTLGSSMAGGKEASSAAAAVAAALGGGVGGVVAGRDSTDSIAQGKYEGYEAGEDGRSMVESQSAGVGDGDDEGAGTQEENNRKKNSKRKKPLSSEERDQLYAMTTSERAGYDVIFMQVRTLACYVEGQVA